ncbi:MAG: hypothetical protein KatS3mg031_1909 [Chitinophagales bacterium]|nr:MAG: hypothetical protein KatS3mg031_1909 [Chitinophagales bacterium]
MRIVLFFVTIAHALSAGAQKNLQLRGMLSYPENLSNVWGYADSLSNEYALVGVYNGLSIVDVTNPDSIRELFFIPGPKSAWRNIKVWNKHAYVTNETDSGILIADLSLLPDSVSYRWWTGDSLISTAHTAYIDENGYLYCNGYNNVARNIPYDQRGILICNLNPDPQNPVFAGSYNLEYVHDCYVRGDTIWAAQISDGTFAVVDVSDKSSPVLLAVHETPSRFTHNCWLSDNGKYLFTTDERAAAFIGAYDVSDLDNIRLLDTYQAAPFTGLIPHNVYWHNDFLIIAYYKYGVAVVDATVPSNLVEIGHYDTSPFPNSEGYQGCWGVYPYLPSGNILATDIETGLYVFTPQYKRACYLTGRVLHADTHVPLQEVSVEVMTTGSIKHTNLQGYYSTGASEPGVYDVRFYKDGCVTKIITGIALDSARTDTLDVYLSCTTVGMYEPSASEQILLYAAPAVFDASAQIYYQVPNRCNPEHFRIQVFNVSGMLVKQLPLIGYSGEIQIRSLPAAGVYLVRITNGNITRHIKIMKM